MSPTDYILLKKIKSGDRPAFMLLYDRYWDSLYRFVFVRTRDKEVSEEILQNLWMKILENTDVIQTDETESAKATFSVIFITGLLIFITATKSSSYSEY